jgi:threonine dehydrogenase-like Zn-dependent dehydrogenase
MQDLFWRNVGIFGGPPGRELPACPAGKGLELEDRTGKVFDLMLPLEEVAEAYRAMDERRAIKVLLQP